jgi:4-hydroxy-tetrahydrodipicolinate synthase
MSQKQVFGVYAAVLTPRFPDDSIDVAALGRLIEFQMGHGISSFAMNGATGEFCLTTPEQLRLILRTVKEASQGKAQILCGVGAAGTAGSIALAKVAAEEGAKALLLPMPYFFPYPQEDLDAFSRAVAGSTELPILLYNLPQFTSGLDKDTVRTLITEVPNIIGIKDSSGSLDILHDLTLHGVDACRIVGNDNALALAMSEGVCDGVVSGVACALPEVILALWAQNGRAESGEFAQAASLLREFIEQLNPFPTPWGLKWIVESRGVQKASFAQPVTAHRLTQAAAMMAWFGPWYERAMQAIATVR